MSRVTDVIVAIQSGAPEVEQRMIDRINTALWESQSVRLFAVADHAHDGSKIMNGRVLVGAVNHLDVENLVAVVRAAIEPEDVDDDFVQVLIRPEEHTAFENIDLDTAARPQPASWERET